MKKKGNNNKGIVKNTWIKIEKILDIYGGKKELTITIPKIPHPLT